MLSLFLVLFLWGPFSSRALAGWELQCVRSGPLDATAIVEGQDGGGRIRAWITMRKGKAVEAAGIVSGSPWGPGSSELPAGLAGGGFGGAHAAPGGGQMQFGMSPFGGGMFGGFGPAALSSHLEVQLRWMEMQQQALNANPGARPPELTPR